MIARMKAVRKMAINAMRVSCVSYDKFFLLSIRDNLKKKQIIYVYEIYN
jgi:hypothetical protein